MRQLVRTLCAVMLILVASGASAQMRTRIANCWQQGATNAVLMQMCSGTFVPYEELVSCLSGGDCFGESVIGMTEPLCGSFGLQFCPSAQQCGRPFGALTIGCQFSPYCGSPPYPACINAQPCGMPGTFSCGDTSAPVILPSRFTEDFEQLQQFQPTFTISIPNGDDLSPLAKDLGLTFAAPAIPDEHALQSCFDTSSSESEFFSCMTHTALPDDYRQVQHCLEEHLSDAGEAAFCSIGNADAQEAYRRFSEVSRCIDEQGQDEFGVAGCLGDQALSGDERYYFRCVTDNDGDLDVAAVCALARDLNPEQQIALACAVQTGGEPRAFAICTAGRLTARELKKCWSGGIGTPKGCFGPNNELRRAANVMRDSICDVTGTNSEICNTYGWWQDNVTMPGPNHEVVRHLNNAIGDLRDGPGEGNEAVKVVNQAEEVFQTIGSALGF
jgi:hypothetical protein